MPLKSLLTRLLPLRRTRQELKSTSSELSKYKLVLDQAPAAVYILNKDMYFEYINPCYTKQSGYAKEDLLNKHINDTIYKGEIADPHPFIAEALLRGETWQGELLSNHKSGKTYWVHTIASPYKDESGKVDGFIIIQQDISEHKQMENNLKESENLYRNLIENSLDSVVLTQDFKFLFVNRIFLEMVGYTHEELLNIEPTSIIAPEDRERVVSLHRMRMNGELSNKTYQANFIRKDGSRFLAEMNSTSVVINGKPASLLTMRDVTERENLAKALRENEAKYKALVENSQDSITIIRDNRILFANQTYCNMLGYTTEELYNMPSVQTLHPDDHEKAFNIAKRRLEQDFSTINEVFRMVSKNGEIRECETSSIMIEYNGVMASFFTSHDITESKRMQEALTKSEQRFRELTEMLPQAIYELDVNFHPTFMNRAGRIAFRIDGSSEKKAYEFFAPEDMQKIRESLERESKNVKVIDGILQPFNSEPMEFTAKRTDGTTFPVIIYGTPIVENGVVTGSRGIIIDISDRKTMEDELRESELKYRLLFEAESDAIFMIDTENGQIIDANPAASAIYGYSRDELLAMKNTDISAEPEKTTEATIRNDTKVLLRYHRKNDGTVFPVELSAGFTTYKNRNIQIVTSRDITENKQMQDALGESEKKYRELADFMPQTIYEIDRQGNLLYMNKSGMEAFGLTEVDYGKSCLNSFVPEDRDIMVENLRMTMAGSRPKPMFEYTAVSRSGRIFPVVIYGTPMVRNNKVVGTRGIIIDVSDRKAAELALRESEEKYRTLIENATDGIVIAQKGILMFANPAMCEIMGYPFEELINQPYLDFVVPDDHQVMIDFHKRRMVGESFTSIYRSRFIRKDGKIITVELNARTSVYNGEPAAFIVIRDITERINIENELKQAKEELEHLNGELEDRIIESSQKLAETSTQLINLQKENLQSQFEVLRQQVNPHFLFNSLNVLTSLIKLEPDLAEQFSEHLSKVYRYVLENKDNELVDLNTELRFLDAYIFLLNIRFIDKIKVQIDIPAEKRSTLIIPLAMQLLIENAIKHNIMTKNDPLVIDIFIDGTNYLNVVNNLQERPSQLISTGVGLKNIQNRYMLLNYPKPIFEKTENQFIAKVPLI